MKKPALAMALLLGEGLCLGASFDCSRASSEIEKMVCESPMISRLDDELNQEYSSVRKYDESESNNQRRWLSERNKCLNEVCLHQKYEKRISELQEKRSKIDNYSSNNGEAAVSGSRPDDAAVSKGVSIESELAAMCSLIAKERTRGDVLSDQQTVHDINNDGVNEVKTECYGGTMHVPCKEYAGPDGKPIYIEQIDFEWKDHWTYGMSIFSFRGRTYTLNTYDDAGLKPAYVTYVTPENKEYIVCLFQNDESEIVNPSLKFPRSKEICGAVAKADAESIDFGDWQNPELKGIEDYPVEQGGVSGLAEVDYDNDRSPNKLVQFEVASGAGRGCDYLFYLEVMPDGKTLFKPSDRLLDKLTNMASCGSDNKFLTIGDMVVYETKSEDLHEVRAAKNGKVFPVCSYENHIKTSVSKVMSPN